MSSTAEYILQVGYEGAERLDRLNELHGRHSEVFLSRYDLSHCQRVLDIGCGAGHMSRHLAQRVSANGEVIALDASAEQLSVAKRLSHAQRISNIRFIHQSLDTMSYASHSFDAIYCRYVLLHIPAAETVIQKLYNLLKPSGRLLCEEPTISTSFCYPNSDAYNQSRHLLRQLSELRHLDFDIGIKLNHLMQTVGFNSIETGFVQPILKTARERELITMLVEECAPLYLDYELASRSQLQDLMLKLTELSADEEFLLGFPRTTQITGLRS